MPISVDDSIARFAGTPADNTNITSGAFTAPANSLIEVCVEADSTGGPTLTIVVSDSGALTWTTRVERNANEATANGYSGIFTAVPSSAVSRTVSVKRTAGTGGSNQISAKVRVLSNVDYTGTPVDTVGANNEGGVNTTPATTSSITPGADGDLTAAVCDWSVKGPLTSTDLTEDAADYTGNISVMDGYKATTSGVGATANITATGTPPQFKWCQITARESSIPPETAYLNKPDYSHFPKPSMRFRRMV